MLMLDWCQAVFFLHFFKLVRSGIFKFFFTKSTFSFSRINWKPAFFFYNTFYSQSCSQIWFNERFLCHLICFQYRPGFCSRNVFTSFDTSFFCFRWHSFGNCELSQEKICPILWMVTCVITLDPVSLSETEAWNHHSLSLKDTKTENLYSKLGHIRHFDLYGHPLIQKSTKYVTSNWVKPVNNFSTCLISALKRTKLIFSTEVNQVEVCARRFSKNMCNVWTF